MAELSSIRRFLILTLISALVLIIFSAALHGYRATLSISSDLLDTELAQLTQAIAYFNQQDEVDEHRLLFQVWQHEKLLKILTPAL